MLCSPCHECSKIVAVLNGQCVIGRHAIILYIAANDICGYEKEVSVKHIQYVQNKIGYNGPQFRSEDC